MLNVVSLLLGHPLSIIKEKNGERYIILLSKDIQKKYSITHKVNCKTIKKIMQKFIKLTLLRSLCFILIILVSLLIA